MLLYYVRHAESIYDLDSLMKAMLPGNLCSRKAKSAAGYISRRIC